MHVRFNGGRAVVDGRPMRFVQTAHVGGRIQPTLIVIHDTAGALRPFSSVEWLKKNPSKVSAHFVVEVDGTITQMAEIDRMTHHAGDSAWRGRKWCNGFSIGIEIVNPGRLIGRSSTEAVTSFGQVFPLGTLEHHDSAPHGGPGWWLPYDRRQIEAVAALVRGLAIACPTIVDVAGHHEISPGRKIDPGPHFPLDRLRAILSTRAAPPVADLRRVQQRLADLGYHVGAVDGHTGPRTAQAVWSFQRENHLSATGDLDPATVAQLMSDAALPFPNGSREAAAAAGDVPAGETLAGAAVAKRGSEGAGTLEAWSAVTKPLADGQSLLDQVTTARTFGDSLASIADWAMSAAGLKSLIVLGICAIVWHGAHRAAWARVRDFATGRNVGR